MADKCAAGRWGKVVRCYVMVMALCGLRPKEAVGIVWDDVELPDGDGAGWLTVRRSRRRVAAHWLDPEQDPMGGPLKDRDIAQPACADPPPARDASASTCDVATAGPGGLVFHRTAARSTCRRSLATSGGRRGPNCFRPGATSDQTIRVSRSFPGCAVTTCDSRLLMVAPLRRRCHRLRRWSGHKSLSVFLDVHQAVAPGSGAEGVRKLIRSHTADENGAL